MMTEEELRAALAQCIGTTQYFKHGLVRGFVYTDGIQMLAQEGEAYWLIDLVASWQPTIKSELRSRLQQVGHPDNLDTRQVWELEVNGTQAVATCRILTDPSSLPPIVRQEIEFTNFPLQGKTRLYVQDGEVGCHPVQVLMLPSEV